MPYLKVLIKRKGRLYWYAGSSLSLKVCFSSAILKFLKTFSPNFNEHFRGLARFPFPITQEGNCPVLPHVESFFLDCTQARLHFLM